MNEFPFPENEIHSWRHMPAFMSAVLTDLANQIEERFDGLSVGIQHSSRHWPRECWCGIVVFDRQRAQKCPTGRDLYAVGHVCNIYCSEEVLTVIYGRDDSPRMHGIRNVKIELSRPDSLQQVIDKVDELYGPVAQSGERLICNQEAVGS